MHNTILLLLFFLCLDGVSGAETDKTISVMEGDSVTLHSDLTEIQNDDTILWKFGPKGSFISQITKKDNFTSLSYGSDVRFKGRLQVGQNTGSLTIRNTRIRHSGQYQLSISRGRTTSKMFNVAVQRVVSGTDGVKSKPVSVMEGESITLDPDKTLIQGDDLVLWMFGDKGILLAKIDVETKETSLFNADEEFRGRLQLDNQTGSLTITNTRTIDSGLYQLKIRGSESLQQFILTVNEPGLSTGAKVGIGVGVVVLLVAAAAVVGVIYYRRKISELLKQMLPVPVPMPVKKGENVTLKPNYKINKDDVIKWQYGDKELRTLIAEIRGETFTYDHAADERFRDRLDLDKTTGSLTIKNTRTAHAGLYTLEISSSRRASHQIFFVTVKEKVEEKSVVYGGSVTLNTDTEIQRDDQILWMFGDQYNLIAQIRGGTGETYDGDDGRFRGRLKLDEKTGSLIITNITPKHTGLYKLQIISSSRRILCKKFRVFRQYGCKVTAGESVHLYAGLSKIQTNDVIQWMFGDENSLIAEIKGGNGEKYDGPDGRFRDRLELNNQTGALIIKNSTAEHAGRYKLKICSSKGKTNRKYSVTIRDSTGKRVNESAAVEMPLLNESVPDGVNESVTVAMPLLNESVPDGVNEQEEDEFTLTTQDPPTPVNHSDIINISAPATTTKHDSAFRSL